MSIVYLKLYSGRTPSPPPELAVAGGLDPQAKP